MDTPTFRLFDLADELVLCVTEQLDGDIETLRNLAVSCRRLQQLAEPLIYRHVFIRRQRTTASLAHSLDEQSQRAKYIQRLEARCEHDPDRFQVHGGAACHASVLELPSLIRRATTLQDLLIESPSYNYGRWRPPKGTRWAQMESALNRLFRDASGLPLAKPSSAEKPLQALRKLELHLNGAGHRYWQVSNHNGAEGIFAHPTLRELTISCAELPPGALTGCVRSGIKTPLRYLKLIECNLSLEALRDMLALPRSLEYLHIGENCHHRYHNIHPELYEALGVTEPALFVAALAQQRKSLQHLAYDGADLRGAGLDDLTLQDCLDQTPGFEKLQTMHASGPRCPALQHILRGSIKMDPPPLNSLKLSFTSSEWAGLGPKPGDWVKSLAFSIPTLHVVYLVMAYQWSKDQPSPSLKSDIKALEPWLKERGLVLYFHGKPGSNRYIPPYLYGEQEPENELLYASDGGGWTERSQVRRDSWEFDGGDVLDNFDFHAFLSDGTGDTLAFDANYDFMQ